MILSATNERQLSAICDHILEKVSEHPIHKEGDRESKWIVLDYGDVIAHLMLEEHRLFYDLERLWIDCPIIEFIPDQEQEVEL